MMTKWTMFWAALALAAVGTGVSTIYEVSLISSFTGVVGCETSCRVHALGWPVQFIFDNPVISPVESVSITGALLGLDNVLVPELFVAFSFWLVVSFLVIWAISTLRRPA